MLDAIVSLTGTLLAFWNAGWYFMSTVEIKDYMESWVINSLSKER